MSSEDKTNNPGEDSIGGSGNRAVNRRNICLEHLPWWQRQH